jgi:hypothetical protein
MTAEYLNFKEAMTMELTNYIESQARALRRADLDRLVVDLPALRDLSAKIPFRIPFRLGLSYCWLSAGWSKTACSCYSVISPSSLLGSGSVSAGQ